MANARRLNLARVAELTELADFIVPFAIRIACEFRLADHLSDGPQSVADLARATGTDESALYRILRALACKGIFTEQHPGKFGMTPLSEVLRSDHPASLVGAYPFLPAEIAAWSRLDHCVRTGEAAFPLVHGERYWDYLRTHSDFRARVDEVSRSASRLHARTVLSLFPWSEVATVVDVGGGDGAFLAGLLARFPHLRGVLLDLPEVVSRAAELFSAAGIGERAEVVAGDFFDRVPAAADLYILKTVLPGWDDNAAGLILGKVRDAMREDSELLVLEAILPEGDTFDVAKLFDVQTLVSTGTRHRTRMELERLLGARGLAITAVAATPTLTVVQARRALSAAAECADQVG
ncbi:methyltransferase [Nocardia sp. NPDC051321]|uniref:methyltransferase n=1 Tax=Nocardia sp. NPDC051321 TaxID=3364323 RepID=UPI00378E6B35